ncbi:MAG: hypothetical protein IT385_20585 [Deltaproteobacteria bacterium]|nr:hypothetical protein [Deltaproteobacteria bacterium]
MSRLLIGTLAIVGWLSTTLAAHAQCPVTPGSDPADHDGDGVPNTTDACPLDPLKTAWGECGCCVPDTDSNANGVPDCRDVCDVIQNEPLPASELDLVITSTNGYAGQGDLNALFRASPGPLPAAPITTSFSDGGGRKIVGADFDGDGLGDVAIVSQYYGPSGYVKSVVVRKGLGDGRFTSLRSYSLGTSFTSMGDGLAVGNFNGGLPDLVFGNEATFHVWLDPGGPSPASTSFKPHAFATFGPRKVGAGDLDGDGDQDVVGDGNSNSDGHLDFVPNLGSGASWDSVGTTHLTYQYADVVDIAVADLDGLFGDDIIVGRKYGAGFQVHLSQGAGTFVDGPGCTAGCTLPSLPGSGFQEIQLIDVNHDGDLDLVVPGDTTIEVRLGDGAGGFGAAASATVAPFIHPRLTGADPCQSSTCARTPSLLGVIEAGDFVGDGAPDVALLARVMLWSDEAPSICPSGVCRFTFVFVMSLTPSGEPTLERAIEVPIGDVGADLVAIDLDPGDDGDRDDDGAGDACDACPDDPLKVALGDCGCGIVEVDNDGDSVPDCIDGCAVDPAKTAPGQCGCGTADTDGDGDGVADCVDNCPADQNGGQLDGDGDGVGDACDGCPADGAKIAPGACGCGVADVDSDDDAEADCVDLDDDGDGVPDVDDLCPLVPDPTNQDLDADGVGAACGDPDDDADGICDAACPSSVAGAACSGHGVCDPASGCVCGEGYGGVDCAQEVGPNILPCPGAPACSGFGVCDASRGVCVCDDAHSGDDCATEGGAETEALCTNGIDDDGDGLVDCSDPSCAASGECDECDVAVCHGLEVGDECEVASPAGPLEGACYAGPDRPTGAACIGDCLCRLSVELSLTAETGTPRWGEPAYPELTDEVLCPCFDEATLEALAEQSAEEILCERNTDSSAGSCAHPAWTWPWGRYSPGAESGILCEFPTLSGEQISLETDGAQAVCSYFTQTLSPLSVAVVYHLLTPAQEAACFDVMRVLRDHDADGDLDCPPGCDDHGTCDPTSGVCVCDPNWGGSNCTWGVGDEGDCGNGFDDNGDGRVDCDDPTCPCDCPAVDGCDDADVGDSCVADFGPTTAAGVCYGGAWRHAGDPCVGDCACLAAVDFDSALADPVTELPLSPDDACPCFDRGDVARAFEAGALGCSTNDATIHNCEAALPSYAWQGLTTATNPDGTFRIVDADLECGAEVGGVISTLAVMASDLQCTHIVQDAAASRMTGTASGLTEAQLASCYRVIAQCARDVDGNGTADCLDGAPELPAADPCAAGPDNCPTEENTDQLDGDVDGIGDVCDYCPEDPENDFDGDTVCEATDLCPLVEDPLQEDLDANGFGDACEPDPDGDGICTLAEDGGPAECLVDGDCWALGAVMVGGLAEDMAGQIGCYGRQCRWHAARFDGGCASRDPGVMLELGRLNDAVRTGHCEDPTTHLCVPGGAAASGLCDGGATVAECDPEDDDVLATCLAILEVHFGADNVSADTAACVRGMCLLEADATLPHIAAPCTTLPVTTTFGGRHCRLDLPEGSFCAPLPIAGDDCAAPDGGTAGCVDDDDCATLGGGPSPLPICGPGGFCEPTVESLAATGLEGVTCDSASAAYITGAARCTPLGSAGACGLFRAGSDGFCPSDDPPWPCVLGPDSCPDHADPVQSDVDGDGRGDACDPCPRDALDDADGDGACADVDNCPEVANPDQEDMNDNGVGDACDPDSDADGVCDLAGYGVTQCETNADCQAIYDGIIRQAYGVTLPAGMLACIEGTCRPRCDVLTAIGSECGNANLQHALLFNDGRPAAECCDSDGYCALGGANESGACDGSDPETPECESDVECQGYLGMDEAICHEGACRRTVTPGGGMDPCNNVQARLQLFRSEQHCTVEVREATWACLPASDTNTCPLECDPSAVDADAQCGMPGALVCGADGLCALTCAAAQLYTGGCGTFVAAQSFDFTIGTGCCGPEGTCIEGIVDAQGSCVPIVKADCAAGPDNCVTPDPALSYNPDQANFDGDAYGDSCDPCLSDALNDGDGDGSCAEDDNCPTVTNALQEDMDLDGQGDVCDPDADGDGLCNTLCPNDCGGHGACAASGCDCDEGWQGVDCTVPVTVIMGTCAGTDDCSGHGTCNPRTDTCYCDPGFGGADCGDDSANEDDSSVCNDGMDNDGDGAFDCADAGCRAIGDCDTCNLAPCDGKRVGEACDGDMRGIAGVGVCYAGADVADGAACAGDCVCRFAADFVCDPSFNCDGATAALSELEACPCFDADLVAARVPSGGTRFASEWDACGRTAPLWMSPRGGDGAVATRETLTVYAAGGGVLVVGTALNLCVRQEPDGTGVFAVVTEAQERRCMALLADALEPAEPCPGSPDPCSGIGLCNPLTGACACPDGYTGEACETLVTTPEICFTGLDEDGDSLFDCDDPDCAELCFYCGQDDCHSFEHDVGDACSTSLLFDVAGQTLFLGAGGTCHGGDTSVGEPCEGQCACVGGERAVVADNATCTPATAYQACDTGDPDAPGTCECDGDYCRCRASVAVPSAGTCPCFDTSLFTSLLGDGDDVDCVAEGMELDRCLPTYADHLPWVLDPGELAPWSLANALAGAWIPRARYVCTVGDDPVTRRVALSLPENLCGAHTVEPLAGGTTETTQVSRLRPAEEEACQVLFDDCTVMAWDGERFRLTIADFDRNGIADCDQRLAPEPACEGVDNCPIVPNADQANADHDLLGDVCDDCPRDADNDVDGDTICGDVDNCPEVSNGSQVDFDDDDVGDLCDFDVDGDGVCNALCPFDCGGHGTCTSAGCVCDPGYGGAGCEPSGAPEATCADGCGDGVCNPRTGLCHCPAGAGGPSCAGPREADCGDGTDDDGDHAVDCADPDCASAFACNFCPTIAPCSAPTSVVGDPCQVMTPAGPFPGACAAAPGVPDGAPCAGECLCEVTTENDPDAPDDCPCFTATDLAAFFALEPGCGFGRQVPTSCVLSAPLWSNPLGPEVTGDAAGGLGCQSETGAQLLYETSLNLCFLAHGDIQLASMSDAQERTCSAMLASWTTDSDLDGTVDALDPVAPECPGDPPCSGNGTCDEGTGLCWCQDGFGGLDCAGGFGEETECGNGWDDNGDGLVDCADVTCRAHPDCQACGLSECNDGAHDVGDACAYLPAGSTAGLVAADVDLAVPGTCSAGAGAVDGTACVGQCACVGGSEIVITTGDDTLACVEPTDDGEPCDTARGPGTGVCSCSEGQACTCVDVVVTPVVAAAGCPCFTGASFTAMLQTSASGAMCFETTETVTGCAAALATFVPWVLDLDMALTLMGAVPTAPSLYGANGGGVAGASVARGSLQCAVSDPEGQTLTTLAVQTLGNVCTAATLELDPGFIVGGLASTSFRLDEAREAACVDLYAACTLTTVEGRMLVTRIRDLDADGIADCEQTGDEQPPCDGVDNCAWVANAAQDNFDGDAAGDACDVCPEDALDDEDGDTLCANEDNCPTVANYGAPQANQDGDAYGDACDIDNDNDGVCDDLCPDNGHGICGGHGVCTVTGCDCDPGWGGVDCGLPVAAGISATCPGDPPCSGQGLCNPLTGQCWCTGTGGGPDCGDTSASPEADDLCTDALDNDGDGAIDCADPGCASAYVCQTCGWLTSDCNDGVKVAGSPCAFAIQDDAFEGTCYGGQGRDPGAPCVGDCVCRFESALTCDGPGCESEYEHLEPPADGDTCPCFTLAELQAALTASGPCQTFAGETGGCVSAAPPWMNPLGAEVSQDALTTIACEPAADAGVLLLVRYTNYCINVTEDALGNAEGRVMMLTERQEVACYDLMREAMAPSPAACPGTPGPCSGHGLCNPTTNVCLCEAGWFGPGCETEGAALESSCFDGVDDNGDGLTDCGDVGCAAECGFCGLAECNDGATLTGAPCGGSGRCVDESGASGNACVGQCLCADQAVEVGFSIVQGANDCDPAAGDGSPCTGPAGQVGECWGCEAEVGCYCGGGQDVPLPPPGPGCGCFDKADLQALYAAGLASCSLQSVSMSGCAGAYEAHAPWVMRDALAGLVTPTEVGVTPWLVGARISCDAPGATGELSLGLDLAANTCDREVEWVDGSATSDEEYEYTLGDAAEDACLDHLGDCFVRTSAGTLVPRDGDRDGVLDCVQLEPPSLCHGDDNCDLTPNVDQSNLDSDLTGDVCDVCPEDPLDDADTDGHCANVDNCPELANADQANFDGDLLGDLCDPDDDDDGVLDGDDCRPRDPLVGICDDGSRCTVDSCDFANERCIFEPLPDLTIIEEDVPCRDDACGERASGDIICLLGDEVHDCDPAWLVIPAEDAECGLYHVIYGIVQDAAGQDVGTVRCRQSVDPTTTRETECETTDGDTLKVYDGLFCPGLEWTP